MNERHGLRRRGPRAKWIAGTVIALALVASSCGYSDDDLAAVETEAAASVADVETELQTALGDAALLRSDIETLEAAAAEQSKVVETQEAELAAAATGIREAEGRADTAEAQVAELLVKYDVEI